MSVPNPFLYPIAKASRRHGPDGYSDYRRFRPWLRDEYCFRCAYCLHREVWARATGDFELDHFLPRKLHPDLTETYGNLVYSCHRCNNNKRTRLVPEPSGSMLLVAADGTISALDPNGERVIDALSLDDDKSTRWRRMWIRIIRSAAKSDGPDDQENFHLLMGFPPDLPNLALESCPSNSRPEGANESWYALKQRGALPLIYE